MCQICIHTNKLCMCRVSGRTEVTLYTIALSPTTDVMKSTESACKCASIPLPSECSSWFGIPLCVTWCMQMRKRRENDVPLRQYMATGN